MTPSFGCTSSTFGIAAITLTGGDPRRLDVSDVEVVETEQRTRAAVALLVDTSWSMVAEGRWVPMKRTALALHQLISTRFRGDDLALITFGRHAPAERLDKTVAKLFGVSRGRAMEWIAEGRVRVGGKRAPKGTPVAPGSRIAVEKPPSDQPVPEPDLPIRIVHADSRLVVADKPAGMPSHPLRPGETGTAANALVGRFPELAGVGPLSFLLPEKIERFIELLPVL